MQFEKITHFEKIYVHRALNFGPSLRTLKNRVKKVHQHFFYYREALYALGKNMYKSQIYSALKFLNS